MSSRTSSHRFWQGPSQHLDDGLAAQFFCTGDTPPSRKPLRNESIVLVPAGRGAVRSEVEKSTALSVTRAWPEALR